MWYDLLFNNPAFQTSPQLEWTTEVRKQFSQLNGEQWHKAEEMTDKNFICGGSDGRSLWLWMLLPVHCSWMGPLFEFVIQHKPINSSLRCLTRGLWDLVSGFIYVLWNPPMFSVFHDSCMNHCQLSTLSDNQSFSFFFKTGQKTQNFRFSVLLLMAITHWRDVFLY